ncbi:MAG: SDR family oxidoreductase [Actinobacteria bacterium]|nr:SDR family oxidoreductase [Actinomycetota bacterium]
MGKGTSTGNGVTGGEDHGAERRAALVTGASSGIGLAIAAMLGEEGYDLTLTSRTGPKLEAAAAPLAGRGGAVATVAADVRDPDEVTRVVAAHRDRYGRLDVLVNNAGLGIVAPLAAIETGHLDLQLAVNLRATILFYREAEPLLRAAGAAHGEALVVNTSSITGKVGEPELGVYSATKHGIVGFTQAMQRELGPAGVKSCVLCPGFVDTQLSDYVKDTVPAATMIRAEDVAEAVRSLLRLSPHCVVPEIVMVQREAVPAP